MADTQFDDLKLQEIKFQLNEYVKAGQLDQRVINLLINGTQCVPLECELLDYKELIEDSRLSKAKIIISIVSLYNTYGGYLLFGVKEKESETEFEVVGINKGSLDVESLKALLNEYTGERINITLQYFAIKSNHESPMYIGLLFVPKRIDSEPLAFGKDGPGDAKKKQMFFAEDVYYRKNDECLLAKGKAVMFLAGDRRSPYEKSTEKIDSLVKKQSKRPNNLPERTFICERFIGRRGVIEQLWMWFADDFSHVRVLAGEGGLGKTSIAYQFSEEVCSTDESPLERVIWLTAKTRQFSGLEGKYLDVPETHFSTYLQLLQTLCRELGYLEEEINEASERLLKHRIAEGARISPSLIVIDDVDSLEPEEQRKVLEIGFLYGGSRTRLLITTRMNQSYSKDIAIQIHGFEIDEYLTFVESLGDRYVHVKLTKQQIESMHSATGGSPMFTEALYRHMRWSSLASALTNWRGKMGEEARAAALKREIELLNPESKRVLLAASYLKDSSYAELSEVTGYPDEILRQSIEHLGSLYLVSAPQFTDEPRFKVSINTQYFVARTQESLAADHARLMQRVKDLKTQDHAHKIRRENPLIGAAISQAIAQLKRSEPDRAIETIKSIEDKFPKHPDLLAMKARCFLAKSTPDYDSARELAREAYKAGNRKPILFEIWYDAELNAHHHNGAVEAADCALRVKDCPTPDWLVRRAAALWHLAVDEERAGNIDRAITDYWACDEDLQKCMALKADNNDKDLLEQRFLAHDSIWKLISKSYFPRVSDATKLFDDVKRMIQGGDYRILNYIRMSEALDRMHKIVNQDRGGINEGMRNLIEQRHREARQEMKMHQDRRPGNPKVNDIANRLNQTIDSFSKIIEHTISSKK